ncbi:unnamed protein product [Eruca vesicaria subsp. sativa]|uniref:Uncharacterized protein n=1 Tax=Eruca vesicaria subsp. sativa TaxID=29727 RepID=A0ABC8KKP3_ERUVS|nr:unnamed protein product [Eruca vesicaria subsp. sativa]
MEEVLEDLNAATLRYMNHPDPTESAARKQRVLLSEMDGTVEETAAGIFQANALAADRAAQALETNTVQRMENQVESPPEVTLPVISLAVAGKKRGRPPKNNDKGLPKPPLAPGTHKNSPINVFGKDSLANAVRTF